MANLHINLQYEKVRKIFQGNPQGLTLGEKSENLRILKEVINFGKMLYIPARFLIA